MRLHRFYVQEKIGNKTSIVVTYNELINHWKNVFRFSQGQQLILFDNSGFDFTAKIDQYSKDTVTLSIIKSHQNTVLPIRETYLFASMVKKNNFEWIAEKATELGVSHIVPVISERSEKRAINIERTEKIIIEAAEQSGRATLPILYEISDLPQTISNYGHIKSIAWDPFATKFVSQDLTDIIGAYIGPEGGWSSKETDLFKKHGIHIHSLGPQVLRAETAAIATISLLVF